MSSIQEMINKFVLKYLAVPKLPSVTEGKKIVTCIGDSITFGAGVRGKRELTWEYHLEKLLGDDYQVLNYGISGRTLLSNGDFPYTEEKQYEHAKSIMADLYIIMLGTNDSKPYNWNEEQYRKELEKFVSEFVNLSNHPRVILMTPPSCFADPALGTVAFDINPDIIANEIYKAVYDVSSQYGLETIDLHTFTKKHPEWFAEGVHPNELGNKCIGEFLIGALV